MMSSKSMEELTEDVKKQIRGVLLSQIGGVPLAQFDRDYRELLGKRFPYRELGFDDIRSCLESMKDTVRFEYLDTLQKWMLFGIADCHSFMSSFAIKAQFTPDKPVEKRKRPKKKNFSSKKLSDSDETTPRRKSKRSPVRDEQNSQTSGLKPNMKGLYGVCVQQLPPDQEEAVQQLFSEVASSVESSRGGVHFFLRYPSREEAEEIISRFHNYQLDMITLKVQPAKEKKEGRENRQPQLPRQQDSGSRGSSNSDSSQGALRSDNGTKINAKSSKSSRTKRYETKKSNEKASNGYKPRYSPNEKKNAHQSSPTEEWGDDDDTTQGQKVPTPPLPWKHTPQANGNVLGNETDRTESPVVRQRDVAPSCSAGPVGSVTQPGSIGAIIDKRTTPKPRLPSILDLADRFKGTKM